MDRRGKERQIKKRSREIRGRTKQEEKKRDGEKASSCVKIARSGVIQRLRGTESEKRII